MVFATVPLIYLTVWSHVWIGWWFLAGRIPRPDVRGAVSGALVAVLLVLLVTSPRPEYPPNDDRVAVEWVLDRLRPGDGLVLSPYGAQAYGRNR